MKKFILSLMIVLGTMSMILAEAEAARLGGGRSSFGRQSQSVTRQAPMQQSQTVKPGQQAAPAAAPAPAPATPQRQPSRWGGMLGGALLGLGLGALLSQMGIGGALASGISTILLIALLGFAAVFIFRMFRRKTGHDEPRSAFAGGYGSTGTPEIGSGLGQQNQPAAFQAEHPPVSGSNAATAVPWGVPADFDVPAFLRSAKTYFIRLQAAWDKADIDDIREFTSPEMFAELRLQIQERGATPNVTDVVALDAELLGIETIGDEYLASVRFSGQIKEGAHIPAEAFVEVWNLARPTSGKSGWVLAGIQQHS